MIRTLENDQLRVQINDLGAELTEIYDKTNDRQVLWNADPSYWNRHAPVLFPNVGRYYENKCLINGNTYHCGQHGFIDAVKQRQNTLMTTMQAIIDLQRPFFLEGDESLLKPMILKDVAERTGLDISTISRVSNSKYVQTNFGIYPLKFFFSDGYTTEDGEEMSVREIRKILKECIDGEDKKKPLTDDELADILKEKGYPIARRTVAKYRQQLNIPVARLRK